MERFFDYKSLLQNKQSVIRVAVIILLILASLFLFLYQTGDSGKEQKAAMQTESENLSEIKTDIPSGYIIVDVAGEVQSPSVVELPIDSRVNDAIEAAGGLTKDADISQINRAAALSDGEKIFIPAKSAQTDVEVDGDEPNVRDYGADPDQATQNGKININQAEASKLQDIPGVGPVTAEKIIAYRKENGLFRKLEDLKKVSGIGDKTFEKMQPYICI